jgi:hypothetical protein
MIEVLPRDDNERALWQATLDLAERLAGLPWTLVGAQMVLLHGFEAGEVPGRTTVDLGLLFDVRAFVGATGEATLRLQSTGFASAGRSPDGVAHRFARRAVFVDILAPDGLGPRTARRTISGGHTVQVPGGSQALERTEVIEVRLGDRIGEVRRPSLLGAILLKARAVDAAPDEAGKHRGDLAFLLGLVPDPRSLALALRPSERRWLARRRELLDQDHVAWRGSRRPEDAYLAFKILSGA